MPEYLKTFVLLSATLGQTTVSPQSADTSAELEEVVVIGALPGPPLWKVTNGEHVLWILPLVNLYPKKMEWESGRVERLIAGSQEYISRPYAANAIYTANPISIVRLMRTYGRTARLQDGEELADVIPSDLYQRYVNLKAQYFPGDTKIDELTPREAGKRMQQRILDAESLEQLGYANASSPEVIMDSLEKWLKRNKTIRRTSTSHVVTDALEPNEIKAWKEGAVAAMSSDSHRDFELGCLAAKISYFESDFESAKKRANAWAQGDADELIRQAAALKNDVALQSLRGPCRDPATLDDVMVLEGTSREKWLAAVVSALANNESTFSVLGINDILAPDGLVAALRTKGYAVEVPR